MFPRIDHIDDILPFLEGKEEFVVKNKGDYVYIDYQIQKEGTFDTMEACECRGIKFWPNGDIAARPLHKFFNRGEKPEEEREDGFRMYLKLDGSLIHFLPIDGEMRAMTKAGITDTSIKCEEELQFSNTFLQACNDLYMNGLTPVFEYTSPNNRIVIRYSEPKITLIAVRNVETGEYYYLDEYANFLGVDRVSEITDPLSSIKDWKEQEGVVLVWEDGLRLKVKSDDYVLKHKTKESLGFEKNVLQLILEDGVDDLAEIIDREDWERLSNYSNQVKGNLKKWADSLEEVNEEVSVLPSRKDQAMRIKELWSEYPVLVPAQFSILDGKGPLEAVKESVRKNLTSSSKVESIRNLIGVTWNG